MNEDRDFETKIFWQRTYHFLKKMTYRDNKNQFLFYLPKILDSVIIPQKHAAIKHLFRKKIDLTRGSGKFSHFMYGWDFPRKILIRSPEQILEFMASLMYYQIKIEISRVYQILREIVEEEEDLRRKGFVHTLKNILERLFFVNASGSERSVVEIRNNFQFKGQQGGHIADPDFVRFRHRRYNSKNW